MGRGICVAGLQECKTGAVSHASTSRPELGLPNPKNGSLLSIDRAHCRGWMVMMLSLLEYSG